MTINHYENFPVASVLLPKDLRPAVRVIYAFARSADDFADEGDFSTSERLHFLQEYYDELDRIEQNQATTTPLFRDLAKVIHEHAIPIQLFRDLLDAFTQDLTIQSYASFEELLDYCRRSANPVGRIMLHLFRQTDQLSMQQSDRICTALQLSNFWQDIAIDLSKSRIYIPQEELQIFKITDIRTEYSENPEAWQALMQYQIHRTREMFIEGAPLCKNLKGRIGFELRMVLQGGLRILEKIEDVQYDVFRKRPTLNKFDGLVMTWRSLMM